MLLGGNSLFLGCRWYFAWLSFRSRFQRLLQEFDKSLYSQLSVGGLTASFLRDYSQDP
jgi:hypothetical protein